MNQKDQKELDKYVQTILPWETYCHLRTIAIHSGKTLQDLMRQILEDFVKSKLPPTPTKEK